MKSCDTPADKYQTLVYELCTLVDVWRGEKWIAPEELRAWILEESKKRDVLVAENRCFRMLLERVRDGLRIGHGAGCEVILGAVRWFEEITE